MKPKKGAATLAAAALVAFWSDAADAYRPFDGTDAAVADTGDVEIELGPVEYLRDAAERTLFAPNLRVNYGFAADWEASLEGEVARGLTAGIPGTSLVESEGRDQGRRNLCLRRDEGTRYLVRPDRQGTARNTLMRGGLATGDEWWRLMPPGTSADALRVLAARGVRAFGDGFVALRLPIYLVELGFSAFAVGAIVTSTLIGTALLTLWVGLIANRYSRRRLLLAAAVLMAATGACFAVMTDFWPLLIIAFVGTMNPTSGDASIFGPLEQTVLTQTVEPRRRTALFARYSVIGSLAGALGMLAASFPDIATVSTGWTRANSMQFMFALYAALGIVAMLLYRPLSPAVEMAGEAPAAPLQQSRRLVYGLAALFGMDSFGTGFLVQSLLALWLYQSFQISITTAAAILFWSGVCSAISYLVAVPIAQRIGLINTMVFTHLPSNIFLILIPFAPDLFTAIGLLLARSALSQMDVPTRSSYVMAVVAPEERPAAASITAVPKTFAWAAGSIISGYLLTLSSFGWPLLIGGVIKGVYDILLLIKFQKVRPPEEARAVAN